MADHRLPRLHTIMGRTLDLNRVLLVGPVQEYSPSYATTYYGFDILFSGGSGSLAVNRQEGTIDREKSFFGRQEATRVREEFIREWAGEPPAGTFEEDG